MADILVVALGGNALVRPGEEGTVAQMRANIRHAMENVLYSVKPDDRLVFVHGNGPQVGALMLKDDAGSQLYGTVCYPLDVLVAETQGELGFLMELELRSLLAEHNQPREVATLVTMVEVDAEDPGFARPAKRVGKMYALAEAEELETAKQWQFAPEIKNGTEGYRRVVPSPKPQRIINREALRTLVREGFISVVSGGGGIPVVRRGKGWEPVEAVIDKDLAAALVAREVDATRFVILTDVPYVYAGYGTPAQRPLEELRLDEIPAMIEEGVFGEGNMLPKILAAMDFVRHTGQTALITDFEGLKAGKGTFIRP